MVKPQLPTELGAMHDVTGPQAVNAKCATKQANHDAGLGRGKTSIILFRLPQMLQGRVQLLAQGFLLPPISDAPQMVRRALLRNVSC